MLQTTEMEPLKATEPHLEQFERFGREGNQPSWLYPLRKAGIARFAELGFPTLKDEDWRFTNMAPVAKLPFHPVLELRQEGMTAERVSKFTFGNLPARRLVFVNGHYAPDLSSQGPQEKGVVVMNLAQALRDHSDTLERHLGRYGHPETNAFSSLNTAFFQDGAFVHITRGKALQEPIHLLYVSTAKEPGATASPRNLVLAEQGSQLTVLETYVSSVNSSFFTNAVTELVIGDRAAIEHVKFQDESQSAYHMAAIYAHLGRGSRAWMHSIATGARLSRNNIHTKLAGEGLECVLNGLYLTRGDQLADHHMIVEHGQPHCASHEYYNGILDGRSKGVFHGRILVRQAAQKTDAKQTNRNLLLSEEATVDTKPQLEIYADDVKCTHGATVGQLNEESIFYLRTRGIGAQTARRMLIHAFAGEITERVRHRPAREELDQLVWDRLEANPHLREKA
jgi:Fe-S cluster assembly protein SufD